MATNKMSTVSSTKGRSLLIEQSIMSSQRVNNQSTNSLNGELLAGSSFNTSKVDFRNPFLREKSTFGSSKFGKINKKVFMREFKGEFVGNSSPPPTKYDLNQSDFSTQKFGSKNMPRDMRICPMVSKH